MPPSLPALPVACVFILMSHVHASWLVWCFIYFPKRHTPHTHTRYIKPVRKQYFRSSVSRSFRFTILCSEAANSVRDFLFSSLSFPLLFLQTCLDRRTVLVLDGLKIDIALMLASAAVHIIAARCVVRIVSVSDGASLRNRSLSHLPLPPAPHSTKPITEGFVPRQLLNWMDLVGV